MRNGFLDQCCQRVVCITLIKEQSKIREDYRHGRPQVARKSKRFDELFQHHSSPQNLKRRISYTKLLIAIRNHLE